ncbi:MULTISPECIES: BREX-1 system adenine-specific DNA-methyltransferase PglX [Thiorhodovibrio]|uniref:BREX-1 system adenine-specific DNA-methyltransferase PglX n=1 Tax=Thiorhodovibrio TaxID=61593 RepID=UPI001911EAFB|nr:MULTISPECIES: BREX-1 system adenine-specific DNA-methyltransferase PglX [Thiorhodovibrio]WPL13185.1 Type I restriction-modification system methyltransferase subunit [Thiorhodovibrio litoralis]
MAFDKATRNALQKFVARARRLLSDEFTRQLQASHGMDPTSGVVADMAALSHLDNQQLQTAAILRETLHHYLAVTPGKSAQERGQQVLQRMVREQAFTLLNRLAALRMAESRGVLFESLTKGQASQGFQLYQMVAGTALGEVGDVYRQYLLSLFDELGQDLPVLFDRYSPQGLLFPKDSVLLELIDAINHPDIVHLWAEDETIGWIYQYYNDPDERKKMRAASAAPRNARELAVRNQFFTPRYVVEFLTDNTLGRIWYEMTQGQTRLVDQCRYLVRRPTEIFLNPGEAAPELPETEGLSQEELLRQPVYIPHRPLKDPRDIRLLDPACGSMHFGLYGFDLFETIYEEAWDQGLCPALQQAYASKEDFLKDVPRLIIEHNIHGIDIDPRAVQIAGLSLWLRAQRSWLNQGVKTENRPRIRRSNVVCAEPMPGSAEQLEAFIATLGSPLLGDLVRIVFDKMQLAGEAGALLKIEDEIRIAIEAAREQWRTQQDDLFTRQDASEADFFDTAEQQVMDALRAYAEQADVHAYQRRLFAEDAARGFAFIDLCRKRYDVVVMNPPFGEPSEALAPWLEKRFTDFNKNILCAFLFQAYKIRTPGGKVGSIYDRTAVIKNTYEKFRLAFFVADDRLHAHCDLGWDVLDANVEATSSILGEAQPPHAATFFDVRLSTPDQKGPQLLQHIQSVRKESGSGFCVSFGSLFSRFPNAVLGYDFPDIVKQWFATLPSFEDQGVQVIAGHTILSDRYFRSWWEIPLYDAFHPEASWQRLYNGGEYSRFNSPLCDAVFYGKDGSLISENTSTILRNLRLQQKGVIGFGKRGEFIDAHVLPKGFISSVEGQAVVIRANANVKATLAILNSTLFQAVINLYCGQHKYPGYVHLFPCPDWSNDDLIVAGESAFQAFRAKERLETGDETNPRFLNSESLLPWNNKATERFRIIAEDISVNEARLNGAILDAYGGREAAESFINPYIQREPKTGGATTAEPVRMLTENHTFFFVGTVFGRWDIRYATGERQPPELPDPFDPLPVCPPGMLQNADGLPAEPKDLPTDYPLRISWPGILVDDESYPEDIVARVREAIEVVWKDRAGAIEQEACEILGVKSLRDYFRRPAAFFADHLKRYSKSRRQAPIYWPLSTPSGRYTLWLYYHRLTPQTLYSCVNDFLDGPQGKLAQVRASRAALANKTTRTPKEEKDFATVADLDTELTAFRDQLLRIARDWQPNLNDGVQITAAPLWPLFKLPKWQKTLKDTWTKLEQGDYDWAHLALSYWPERVLRKCHQDRSLAIAHGVEQDFWEEVEVTEKPKGKGRGKAKGGAKLEWRPKPLSDAELARLIQRLMNS